MWILTQRSKRSANDASCPRERWQSVHHGPWLWHPFAATVTQKKINMSSILSCSETRWFMDYGREDEIGSSELRQYLGINNQVLDLGFRWYQSLIFKDICWFKRSIRRYGLTLNAYNSERQPCVAAKLFRARISPIKNYGGLTECLRPKDRY
jgi:hypothetical protein